MLQLVQEQRSHATRNLTKREYTGAYMCLALE